MHYLAATLHTLGVRRHAHTRAKTPSAKTTSAKTTSEAEGGSVTIEQVLWAIAMIAIVGIVVAAITAYVTTKAASIT